MNNDVQNFKTDDSFELVLTSILETKIKTDDHIMETIFIQDKDKEETKKENIDDQIKAEDCLEIEDHDFTDIFSIEDGYQRAVNELTDEYSSSKLKSSLKDINRYDSLRDSTRNISPINLIENMVESTYSYDRNLKEDIAEEICYLKKIANLWRPIGGDGNCFYRSVMFAYLENLIFQKDIIMLKKITAEIYTKFNSNYSNTKKLPFSIRNIFDKINKNLVISILSMIIEELDTISLFPKLEKEIIKNTYDIFIKSFNFAKHFDTVNINILILGYDIIFKI
jgi:hypothetical protein